MCGDLNRDANLNSLYYMFDNTNNEDWDDDEVQIIEIVYAFDSQHYSDDSDTDIVDGSHILISDEEIKVKSMNMLKIKC